MTIHQPSSDRVSRINGQPLRRFRGHADGANGSDRRASADARLVRALEREDASALDELYQRYRSDVYAACLRVLGNAADAEDTLLDTFWELWRRPQRYDPARATVRGYLLLMARSRAADRRRRHAARRRAEHRCADLASSHRIGRWVDGASPCETAWRREEGARVRSALAAVDPAERRVIELAFYEGLSHQRIAERLGQPLGTIKTRIRQGLLHLRDRLHSDPRTG